MKPRVTSISCGGLMTVAIGRARMIKGNQSKNINPIINK